MERSHPAKSLYVLEFHAQEHLSWKMTWLVKGII